jgi:hypothetical protein
VRPGQGDASLRTHTNQNARPGDMPGGGGRALDRPGMR